MFAIGSSSTLPAAKRKWRTRSGMILIGEDRDYVVRARVTALLLRNSITNEYTTKNHKSRRVPLSQELVKLLRKRQKASGSVWLFPNDDGQPEGHFLRKFKKIARTAGLNCGRCISTRVVGQYENKKAVTSSCADNPEGCAKHYLHRLRKTRATFLA